jgi:hypothetical protein
MSDVTPLLNGLGEGDARAASRLPPPVYGELRKLAAQSIAQEQPGQTLQPPALVHEAYLRLVDRLDLGALSLELVHRARDGRGHFFAASVSRARRQSTEAAPIGTNLARDRAFRSLSIP